MCKVRIVGLWFRFKLQQLFMCVKYTTVEKFGGNTIYLVLKAHKGCYFYLKKKVIKKIDIVTFEITVFFFLFSIYNIF